MSKHLMSSKPEFIDTSAERVRSGDIKLDALRLAERFEVTDVISDSGNKAIREAAAELRRLTEVNQELLKILAYVEASDLGAMLCARARAAIAMARGEG